MLGQQRWVFSQPGAGQMDGEGGAWWLWGEGGREGGKQRTASFEAESVS